MKKYRRYSFRYVKYRRYLRRYSKSIADTIATNTSTAILTTLCLLLYRTAHSLLHNWALSRLQPVFLALHWLLKDDNAETACDTCHMYDKVVCSCDSRMMSEVSVSSQSQASVERSWSHVGHDRVFEDRDLWSHLKQRTRCLGLVLEVNVSFYKLVFNCRSSLKLIIS